MLDVALVGHDPPGCGSRLVPKDKDDFDISGWLLLLPQDRHEGLVVFEALVLENRDVVAHRVPLQLHDDVLPAGGGVPDVEAPVISCPSASVANSPGAYLLRSLLHLLAPRGALP